MSTTTDPLAYRPDIDGLRAVAVLGILLFHLEVPGFGGGYVGVDVFFVVSGYLITRNIVSRRAAGSWSLAGFYGRRLRRLFPAIFFTLALTFVAGFLLLSPKHFADLAQSILYTGVLAPNVFFLDVAGYFATLPLLRPLLHFWSLGVEEQYYLVWPIALLALLRWRRVAIVAALGLLAVVSVVAGEHQIGVAAVYAFYLLPFRCTGLLLGAVLVFVPRPRRGTAPLPDALVAAGLGLIGWAMTTFDAATPYPGLHVALPVVGAALVVLAGDAAATSRVLLANGPMVWIGLVSFSLYLIHWPLLVLYGYWTLEPLGVTEQIAIVVASLVAATGMYRFVERPFRAGPHGRLTPAGFAAGCLALMLPVMFLAANVWAKEGLPWRVTNRSTFDERRVDVPCRRGRLPGCKLGRPGPQRGRMLLIGDSEADSLSAGVYYLARRNGFQVRRWTEPACPPLFDVPIVPRLPDARKQEACAESRAAWKAFIAERRPQIVVLAGRWIAYVANPKGSGLAHRGPSFETRSGRANPPPAVGQDALRTELARTVAAVVATGAKVVVVSSAPEPPLSLSACRDVPLYLMSEEARRHRCVLSYAQAMAQVGFVDAAIAGLEQADVMPIVPSRALCDESRRTCAMYDDEERPLYRNATHLGPVGSRFLATHVAEEFAARVRDWGLSGLGRRRGPSRRHLGGSPNS